MGDGDVAAVLDSFRVAQLDQDYLAEVLMNEAMYSGLSHCPEGSGERIQSNLAEKLFAV